MLPISVLLLDLALSLNVQSRSPDALCPDAELTRRVVAARVGTLKVAESGWRLVYTIGHAPDTTEGDFIRVEIVDASDVVRLRRDLPMASSSCLDMAHAIALVADRFFRSLAAEPQPPADRKTGTTAARMPRPAAPRAPENRPREQPLPSAGGPVPRSRWLMVGLGTGVSTRIPSSGVSLDLSSGMLPRWEFGLDSLLLFGSRHERAPGGIVEMKTLPLRTWITYAITRGRLDVTGGPELFTALDWARRLDRQHSERRFVFGLGARAELRAWATDRIGLTLTGSLDFPVSEWSGEYWVGAREVLSPGPVFGSAGLGLTWRVF